MTFSLTATNPARRIVYEQPGSIPMIQRGENLGISAGTGQQMRERIIVEHLSDIAATAPALTRSAKEKA